MDLSTKLSFSGLKIRSHSFILSNNIVGVEVRILKLKTKIGLLIVIAAVISTAGINAQENDFFTDSSLLKPWIKGTFDQVYLDPDGDV